MISWESQFDYKFLISMDGNGATCQRIAVALKSNSVLLKYESSSILHYFPGLIPWMHYVPINKNEDVVAAVHNGHLGDAEFFKQISINATDFANTYLSEAAVHIYTQDLLKKIH